ncbi:MAG: fatty acid CoA ligase family protein [Acidimicrobiia bacterium]|nr:fatty acid CoA ligase family protein [Acidimicrobiia bacterium]
MNGPATDRLDAWDATHGNRWAVIVAGRRRGTFRGVTFHDLRRRTDALAAGFRRLDMTDGRRVAMMVPPGRGMFETAYGLMKAGACPVLVDPGIGLKVVGTCLDESGVTALVGTPEALAARRVFRWVPTADTVSAGPWSRRVPTLGSLALGPADGPTIAPADPAAIVFTSGSTGPPKGVLTTHEMFDAQTRMIRDTYGIEPGVVNVATFAPFALIGPLLGMTTILPRMDFTKPGQVDPTRIVEAVQAFGATMMFGSPALLDRLGRYGEASGERLPSLRTVLSAGAPVRPAVQARMLAMLDASAVIATPYGATEALPVASINSRELAGLTRTGICVGRPVDGVDVAVIPVSDAPVASVEDTGQVPAGEIGEIVVQGPNVSPGYDARPEENTMASVEWRGRRAHRMGDLGYLDDEGRLWFAGRKTHRIDLPDRMLATVPLEAIFDEHPGVARSALVSVPSPGGPIPVVCVELEPGTTGTDELAAALLAGAAVHPEASTTGADRVTNVLFHSGFPTDIRHNSKIDRPALGVWAAQRLDKAT